MEGIEVPRDMYNDPNVTPENLQDAIEAVENLSKKRKKRITKRKAKKAKKLTRKAAKKTKKGKSKKAKKLTSRAGKQAKKATRKIKRIKKRQAAVKKIAKGALFAPLIPLKPVMKKILKSKGKPAPNNMADLAKSFYNNIVVKSDSNFDEIPDSFDMEFDQEHAVGMIGTALVSAIITWIKELKKKKEKGGDLTKSEEEVLDKVEKVEEQVEEAAKEEAASEVGESILYDKKTQLYILLAVVGIIILARKVK